MVPRPSSIPPPPTEKPEPCALLVAETRYRLMANDLGCPLPTVHPRTRKEVGFADEKYLEELEKEHPEEFKIWENVVHFLEEGSGMTINELRNCDRRKKRALVENLEKGIINRVPFLDQYTSLEQRKREMAQIGKRTNDYYRHIIENYLPEYEKYLSWDSSGVAVENNIGQLAVKFLSDGDITMRHEAKMKFLLMLHIGITMNHRKPDVDFDEALGFFMNFINDDMAHYEKHEKPGATKTKFLVSAHANKDKRVKKAKIMDSPKSYMPEQNTHMQPVAMRQALVEKGTGEKRIINFILEPRHKPLFSKASKTLRYRDEPENRDHDYHGIRIAFESIDDLEDFENMMIKKLKTEHSEELIHQHHLAKTRGDEAKCEEILERLKTADQCVEIDPESVRDTLGGGKYEGSSKGSSKKLKVKRFRMNYHHTNGKTMPFEFQFMLLDGYVDTQLRHDVNEKEYRIKRAFEDGLIPLLVPNAIYPRVDLARAKVNGVNAIRNGIRTTLCCNKKKGEGQVEC